MQSYAVPSASVGGAMSASGAASAGQLPSGSGGVFFPSGSPLPVAVPPMPTVLDKAISRGTGTVSLSAFSYLFSELVQYCQQRVDVVADLEKRLADVGYGIGLRSLELITYRSSIQAFLLTNAQAGSGGGGGSGASNVQQQPISLQNIASIHGRKERNLVGMLQLLHSSMWKSLFGRSADGLEKATDKEDEYYIYDREPITNRFIATPKEFAHFNCATFVAGIINGILDGAEFHADVSAHFNTTPAGLTRTVFVIKFNRDVTKRDA